MATGAPENASSRRSYTAHADEPPLWVTPSARSGIGVAGLGYWGPNLARNSTRRRVQLTWMLRPVRPRAGAAVAVSAGRITADLNQLLADGARRDRGRDARP